MDVKAAAPLVDNFPEAPFYIPATGPASRPRRTLKHADTFIVLDSHGDIGASGGGPDLYDCRRARDHEGVVRGESVRGGIQA